MSYFDTASGWERSHVLAREKSERRAWLIAGVAIGIAALSVIAVTALTPLKKVVPFLVSIDKASGETQVVAVLDAKAVTHNELVDRYWVMDYVRARERYDWGLLQYDYDTVIRLSDDKVAKQYATLYQGDDALDKRIGANTEMRVNILSVALPSSETGKAVVRFDRSIKRDDMDSADAPTRFVATLAYDYKPALRGRERDLIENPLGFRVTAYTVDQELIDPPHADSPSHPQTGSGSRSSMLDHQPPGSASDVDFGKPASILNGSASPGFRK